MSVSVILLVIALLLFIVAACGVASQVNLVAAGLACATASVLIG